MLSIRLTRRINANLPNVLEQTLNSSNFNPVVRYLNANSSSITKIHRKMYARTYPTILVQPDGSTINIPYHEPRKIITLPLDLTKVSDEVRKIRLENRKPKIKVKIEEEIEDTFNARKYLNYVKGAPKKR